MKRIFSMALTVAMLCSLNTTAFAASNETSSNAVNVAVMAESNSTIVGEYKEYIPMAVFIITPCLICMEKGGRFMVMK